MLVVLCTQVIYFLILVLIKTLYGDFALAEFAACQAIFNIFGAGALLKTEKLLIGCKKFNSSHFTALVLVVPIGVLVIWASIKLFLYVGLLSFDTRYLYFGLIAGTSFALLNYFKHFQINEENYKDAYLIMAYPLLAFFITLVANYQLSLNLTVSLIFVASYFLTCLFYLSRVFRLKALFKLSAGLNYIQKEQKTLVMNGIPTILESLASNGPVLLFVSILPPDQFCSILYDIPCLCWCDANNH